MWNVLKLGIVFLQRGLPPNSFAVLLLDGCESSASPHDTMLFLLLASIEPLEVGQPKSMGDNDSLSF